MQKFTFFLLSVLVSMLFSRCSTDVDIYTDYKDITIVYGLLDQSDDTVWLKITKAFQGQGDALYYSKIPDSNNYSYKLDVTLTGIKNGIDVQTLTFDTITIHNKLPGDSVFYFPDQLMYYAVPSKPLNEKAMYHLSVKRKDGEVKAETPIVSDFPIIKPAGYTISFSTDGEIACNSAQNGKRYEFTFTFNYKEHKKGSPDTLNKSISWPLGVAKSEYTTEGYTVALPYQGEQFFNMLETKLEKDPNITRWVGMMNVTVACGSQNLDTYLEINNAANSFMNELPQFTNIMGDATGLLAARHTVERLYKLSVRTELDLHQKYPELGFELNP
jgi:hypothetical protein